MNFSEETYRKIEGYLDGTLSPEEASSFQKEIDANPELQKEVSLQNNLDLVVKTAIFNDLKSQMKNDIRKKDQQKSNWKKAAIAGSAALLLSVGTWLITDDQSKDAPATEPQEKTVQQQDKQQEETAEKEISTGKAEDSPKPDKQEKTPSSQKEKVSQIADSSKADTISKDLQTEVNRPTIQETQEEETIADLPDICKGVNIKANPEVKTACIGKPNGSVSWTDADITGGSQPYLVFHTTAKDTVEGRQFSDLRSGEASFIIMDANGCMKTVSIRIPAKECEMKKYSFNPSAGEEVTIPLDGQKKYHIQVMSTGRKIVYDKEGEGKTITWNGRDTNGNLVNTGIYAFTIEYKDGPAETGQISVIR